MAVTKVTSDEIDDLVDRLEQASVHALESGLRRDGLVQPPAVHMIIRHHPGGYVGFVESRPFGRGLDAALAIRQMGFLPAAMYATRLVVTWERVDLVVALDGHAGARGVSHAHVVLDAHRDGTHAMRVHPFDMIGLVEEDPLRSPALPTWAPTESVNNGGLPAPIEELRVLWREGFNPRQLGAIHEQMVQAGYGVQLYTARD